MYDHLQEILSEAHVFLPLIKYLTLHLEYIQPSISTPVVHQASV